MMEEKPGLCWDGLAKFGFPALHKASVVEQPSDELEVIRTEVPSLLSSPSESPPESSVDLENQKEVARVAKDLDKMRIAKMEESTRKDDEKQVEWRCNSKRKFKKGTRLDGIAVSYLLNLDGHKKKKGEDEEKQRKKRGVEKLGHKRAHALDCSKQSQVFGLKDLGKGIDVREEELVTNTDGTNSLTLSGQATIVHKVTVSCVVDTCHVFVRHMKNPTTLDSLSNLETNMLETFSKEPPKPLLRPIFQGSLFGVCFESRWYRCQAVSYNATQDTCDVKFVDHGGYTTVPADHLRQLKVEFLKLPFQTIEVFLAHVKPSTSEIELDIASEILFHGDVSICLVGQAEDGTPVVQAYYYNGDHVSIFSQDIINSCHQLAATERTM